MREGDARHDAELVHRGDDLARRCAGHVLDDHAVGEEENAIGDGRGTRIVRDHDRRLTELVDRAAHEVENLARRR